MSELNCCTLVGRMSNPTSRSLSVWNALQADGHVYNQTACWQTETWCLLRLHELIGKIRSEWLQAAALSISNPNGRSGHWQSAVEGNDGGRRDNDKKWTTAAARRLIFIVGVEFECWSPLKTNYTPTLHGRCQFSCHSVVADHLGMCIVTYCFHY